MFPVNPPNARWQGIFLGLSLIGAGLLPGLAVQHGLFDFFHKAAKSSQYRHIYTGHPGVDKELSQLIAFFEQALSRPGLRPLVFSFSGLLGTTLTVAQFAAGSSGKGIAWLLPFPIGILCQMYGAGLAFPLFFSILFILGFGQRQVSARGWVPALLVSFYAAGLPMLHKLPFLDLHSTRTFSALWQLFPVTLIFTRAIARIVSPEQSPRSALRIIGWIAFLMHTTGLVDLYASRDSLYMLDFTSRKPSEVATVFLVLDYVMVVISTVAFVLVANPKVNAGKMAVTSIVAGPGAAIAWELANAPVDVDDTKKKIKKKE